MKVILLANWGMGLEILKVLHSLPDVVISMVVTKYRKDSKDKWENAVYNSSIENDYPTINQEEITFTEIIKEILNSNIDLLISHAYMKKLPKDVFSKPSYGSINIHPSLLPKYRGPSPAHWVLQNRDSITGLTSHYIDENLDTGDIIYQVKIPVGTEDTVDSIIERQKTVIKELVIESFKLIRDPNFIPISQISSHASYAPKFL